MSTHKIYVDGKVHVCAAKCETCIFTANRPVSTRRVSGMVKTCTRTGGVIPCHKHLGDDIEPVCRGFFELGVNETLRLAQAMGVIQEVA